MLHTVQKPVSNQVAVVRVWVSDWQMERSGTPFAIGSRVHWTVSPEVDVEFLAMVVGQDDAPGVTYIEDPRATDENGVVITGTVSGIEAWQCQFEPDESSRALLPVPGSGKVAAVNYAAQWMPDEPPLRFVGWIVDLKHHYLIPRDPLG